MNFICVENVDEVLAIAFDKAAKGQKKPSTPNSGKKGKSSAAASSAA
jgi:ATP-dependent Lon protease